MSGEIKTTKPGEDTTDIRDVDPAAGYVFADVSKSKLEAISKDPFGYDKLIVRSAIEAYIRRWMDSDGVNRTHFGHVIPSSVNILTDKNFNRKEDPVSRHVLLARMFNELRQSVPAILITDAGGQVQQSGIGSYSGAFYDPNLGHHVQQITTMMNVQIEIALVTQDEETTQILYSILIYIFGTARRLGRGDELRPTDPTHNWVVRLPQTFSESGVSNTPIGDDQKDQLWTGSISLEVQYEAVKSMRYDVVPQSNWMKQRLFDEAGQAIDNPNLWAMHKPQILSPTKMNVHIPQRVVIAKMLRIYRVWSDNPRIAFIDPNTYMITPRRPGTFNIVVGTGGIGGANPQSDDQTDHQNAILATQEVTVKL